MNVYKEKYFYKYNEPKNKSEVVLKAEFVLENFKVVKNHTLDNFKTNSGEPCFTFPSQENNKNVWEGIL